LFALIYTDRASRRFAFELAVETKRRRGVLTENIMIVRSSIVAMLLILSAGKPAKGGILPNMP